MRYRPLRISSKASAAAARRGHLVPELRQGIRQHVGGEVVVIYDQDAHDIGSRLLTPARSAAVLIPHPASAAASKVDA